MWRTLLIGILLAVLCAPGFAQVEVTRKDGQTFQGEVLSQTPASITFKVFSKTKGAFTEMTLDKAGIARMHDIIADKDVTALYLGAAAVQPQAAADQSAQPQPSFVVPADTYNGEIGFNLLYRNYPDIDSDVGSQLEFGAGLSYGFTPYQHDDAHRTMASKAVVATSTIGASLNVGPTYEDSPSQVAVRALGAALLNRTVALGGVVLYHVTTVDNFMGYELTQTDWAIGPMIDFFVSPSVRLRELATVGSISESIDELDASESVSTYRYEHYLSVAGDRSFGYSHEIRYLLVEDLYQQIVFQNYFEAAFSKQFSLVPIVGTVVLIPDGGDAGWTVNLGVGFVVYPSSKVIISLLPRYTINTDNDRYNYFEVPLTIGVRF